MKLQDRFDLTGQVAVVTGAGRGIGEGIALDFAEAGASVVLAARRTDEITAVADRINARGGNAIAVRTDVTDDDAVSALGQAAVDNFGSLTIWVNNAGGSTMRMPLT
jgi:NADP-dependent 3-hydroxy acid dehydrogenase YdfG